MRIGLTCTTIEPALTQGKVDGIGVYTQSLLDVYQQKGYPVIPYSFPKLKTKLKHSALPNGKLFWLPFEITSFLSMIPLARKQIFKQAEKNLDLLHVTDHRIPPLTKVPMVATIHDTLMFRVAPWDNGNGLTLKNRFRKRTIRWVQHFITISEAMRLELMEHLHIPSEKISVIHNGISNWWQEKVSEETKQTVLTNYKLPKQFLLFTGTLQARKNVPRLIEAYLSLPETLKKDFPLVIVGKKGWQIDETMAAIKKLKRANAGVWLQDVDNDSLRALFQSASVYVCPSLHEGFGYTALQAFASGTPVLTSNSAASPEIAGDAALLVDPYSMEEIQNGLHTLLTDLSLRQEFIQKGTERVKAFSLEKCAQQTWKLYQSILG